MSNFTGKQGTGMTSMMPALKTLIDAASTARAKKENRQALKSPKMFLDEFDKLGPSPYAMSVIERVEKRKRK